MPEVYQPTAVYPGMRYRATEAPNTDQYLEIADTPSQTDQESTGDDDHYDRLNLYEGLATNVESRRPLPATPTVYERPLHRPPPPPPTVYDCLVR